MVFIPTINNGLVNSYTVRSKYLNKEIKSKYNLKAVKALAEVFSPTELISLIEKNHRDLIPALRTYLQEIGVENKPFTGELL